MTSKLNLRGPWVLIQVERREMRGSLYLPGKRTEVDHGIEGSGKVLDVGRGYYHKMGKRLRWIPIDRSLVGRRVAFRSFLEHANPVELRNGCCILHIKDVVAVVT